MYADQVTDSMERAISETFRRRGIQQQYNREHGITPTTIKKEVREILAHEVTRKVLTEYPIHTFIPAMRLLAYLMKYRSAVGVYCLMKLREGIGRRGIAKKLLKAAGIGR
jgi:hypothetical protein